MKRNLLYAALPLMGVAMAVTSCDRTPKIAGSWTASAPVSIAAEIPAASTANSLLSIDFMNGQSSKEGTFYLSSLIEATQPVRYDSIMTVDADYEVSVSATASVKGTWHFAGDDEVMLAFDMSTLDVDVDPNGVAFSQNMLSGAQQPAVDSLTAKTAKIWERQIAGAFKTALHRYTQLEDMEVLSGGSAIKFEVKDIAGRDRDVILHKVLTSD